MKVEILKVKDGIIEPLGGDMPACVMMGCSVYPGDPDVPCTAEYLGTLCS